MNLFCFQNLHSRLTLNHFLPSSSFALEAIRGASSLRTAASKRTWRTVALGASLLLLGTAGVRAQAVLTAEQQAEVQARASAVARSVDLSGAHETFEDPSIV